MAIRCRQTAVEAAREPKKGGGAAIRDLKEEASIWAKGTWMGW